MFTILAVTDAKFIHEVLISVALVFSHSSFPGMIATGLILGLIFTMLRAFLHHKLEIHYVMISMVCYLCFIVPKVDVLVEDMQNPTVVRTAPDVPLGLAVVGTLMSTVGMNIIETIETAYSHPGLTQQNGFLGTLNRLQLLAEAHKMLPPHITRTVSAYYTYCTHPGMSAGVNSAEAILTAADPLQVMEFPSEVFTTQVWPSAAALPVTVTCDDAYTMISAWFDISSGEMTDWGQRIAEASFDKEPTMDAFGATSDATQAVQSILGASAESFKLALNSAIAHSILDGDAQYAAQTNNLLMTIMLTDGFNQRNVDAYAAALGFQSAMRPFSAFIEGFFFAITPLAVFLFMLGAYGISLVGKYLQLYAWIQLWGPMMALVNFFINYRTKQAISVHSTPLYDVHSIASIYGLSNEVGYWVYVGNTMAAAVPILALILVTGSIYSINSIAAKMAGSDHFDEKKVAPDTFNTSGGSMSFGANRVEFLNNGEVGAKGYGPSSGRTGTIEFDSRLQNQLREAESVAAKGSVAVGREFGRHLQNVGALTDGFVINKQWQEGFAAKYSETWRWAEQKADRLLQGTGLTADSREGQALTAHLAAQVSLGQLLGLNKLGFDASAGITKEFMKQLGITDTAQLSKNIEDVLANEQNFSSMYDKQVGWNHGYTRQQMATDVGSKSISEGLKGNVSSLLEAQEVSEAARAFSQGFGHMQRLSIAERAEAGAMAYASEMAPILEAKHPGKKFDTSYQKKAFWSNMLEQEILQAYDAVQKGDLSQLPKLGRLVNYGVGYEHLQQAFRNLERKPQPGSVRVPGSDHMGTRKDVEQQVSRAGLPISPTQIHTPADTAQLQKVGRDFAPGGRRDDTMQTVQNNADLDSQDARQRVLDVQNENDRLVGLEAEGLKDSHSDKEVAFTTAVRNELLKLVDNGRDGKKTAQDTAQNIRKAQPELLNLIFEEIGGNDTIAAVQEDMELSAKDLTAFMMVQAGQLEQKSPINAFDMARPGKINSSFSTANGSFGDMKAAEAIDEVYQNVGGTQGNFQFVQRMTALNNHLQSVGMGKVPVTELVDAYFGGDDAWHKYLQKFDGSPAEIKLDQLDAEINENPNSYPTEVVGMMGAAGMGSGTSANLRGATVRGGGPRLLLDNTAGNGLLELKQVFWANRVLKDAGLGGKWFSSDEVASHLTMEAVRQAHQQSAENPNN